jgi:hypothetical protein
MDVMMNDENVQDDDNDDDERSSISLLGLGQSSSSSQVGFVDAQKVTATTTNKNNTTAAGTTTTRIQLTPRSGVDDATATSTRVLARNEERECLSSTVSWMPMPLSEASNSNPDVTYYHHHHVSPAPGQHQQQPFLPASHFYGGAYQYPQQLQQQTPIIMNMPQQQQQGPFLPMMPPAYHVLPDLGINGMSPYHQPTTMPAMIPQGGPIYPDNRPLSSFEGAPIYYVVQGPTANNNITPHAAYSQVSPMQQQMVHHPTPYHHHQHQYSTGPLMFQPPPPHVFNYNNDMIVQPPMPSLYEASDAVLRSAWDDVLGPTWSSSGSAPSELPENLSNYSMGSTGPASPVYSFSGSSEEFSSDSIMTATTGVTSESIAWTHHPTDLYVPPMNQEWYYEAIQVSTMAEKENRSRQKVNNYNNNYQVLILILPHILDV